MKTPAVEAQLAPTPERIRRKPRGVMSRLVGRVHSRIASAALERKERISTMCMVKDPTSSGKVSRSTL